MARDQSKARAAHSGKDDVLDYFACLALSQFQYGRSMTVAFMIPDMKLATNLHQGLSIFVLTCLLSASNFAWLQGIGSKAPAFRLLDAEAEPIELSDFAGKPVILNFWASWCPPCVAELPFLEALVQDINGPSSSVKLEVLLINNGEDAEQVRDFLNNLRIDLPMAFEPSREQIATFGTRDISLNTSLEVIKAYRVRGMPTSVFIDSQGLIRAVKVGFLLPAEMPGLLASIGLNWQAETD